MGKKIGTRHDQILMAGDGVNNIKMTQTAGISVGYQAQPAVRNQANYLIRRI